MKAVDDDQLSWLEPATNDAQSVDDRAELDRAVLDRAVASDDIHVALIEVRSDSAILNQQRAIPGPAWQVQSDEGARRQRVIAVALRYRGYGYQHHHIPDWDPPPEWPWKPTCAGV